MIAQYTTYLIIYVDKGKRKGNMKSESKIFYYYNDHSESLKNNEQLPC